MPPLYLTSAQSRAVDQYAIGTLGVPGVVLMENAGRGATEQILLAAAERGLTPQFVVLTGSGNNAGDGFVIVRHLLNHGHVPVLIRATPAERLTGDARVMSDICLNLNIAAHHAGNPGDWRDSWLDARPLVLIDALMGTGAKPPARPHFADLIRHANRLRQSRPQTLTIAIDLPSGLDVDTAQPSDPTIEADLTFTFGTLKTAYANPAASRFTGEVKIIPIGIPESAIHASLKQ